MFCFEFEYIETNWSLHLNEINDNTPNKWLLKECFKICFLPEWNGLRLLQYLIVQSEIRIRKRIACVSCNVFKNINFLLL